LQLILRNFLRIKKEVRGMFGSCPSCQDFVAENVFWLKLSRRDASFPRYT